MKKQTIEQEFAFWSKTLLPGTIARASSPLFFNGDDDIFPLLQYYPPLRERPDVTKRIMMSYAPDHAILTVAIVRDPFYEENQSIGNWIAFGALGLDHHETRDIRVNPISHDIRYPQSGPIRNMHPAQKRAIMTYFGKETRHDKLFRERVGWE